MKHILRPKLMGLAFMSFLFIASCSEDDTENLTEPSHRIVLTSEMDFENKVEINNSITFGDASPGVVSREWNFPEGAANVTTSTEQNIKAVFTKAGIHNVTLNQTFKNDAYVGTKLKGKELDTTIVVTVLNPVKASIIANYVNPDGTLGAALNISENAENEVVASRSVQFSYVVDGEPESFIWNIEGGDPETFNGADTEVNVKYKRQGIYDLRFAATRQRPFGGDTISFKNLIKVIPSTDPVDLEKVADKDGSIALVFSREMDEASINPADFNVTITNNDVDIPNTIGSVSVDSNEGNVVIITLDGTTIYNNDIVKVSYTKGDLQTLDGVAADSFVDSQLIFDKVNILKEASDYDYSFENSTASNWPYMNWGAPWDAYSLEISSDQAQDGTNSAYIEMDAAGGMIIGHRTTAGEDITFPVEAGKTYEIGVWVYVTSLGNNNAAGFDPDLRFFWFPDTDWAVGGNPTFGTDFSVGEWVYSSTFVEFSTTGDKTFQIRGYNQDNADIISFYMDNLSVSEASLRP
ncbi:PKD domain-containing protein [Cellulophaga fucicola]|uniref:PKD domain-containing protein n=1 Tax=Cellulophaga fucicola TaxID=76595 RepID=UPI003EB6D84E